MMCAPGLSQAGPSVWKTAAVSRITNSARASATIIRGCPGLLASFSYAMALEHPRSELGRPFAAV